MSPEIYHPPADPALQHRKRRSPILNALIPLALVGILAAMIVPTIGRVSDCGRRGADSSNLRQVGQACHIYAYDHKNQFPQADDIHAFAFQLAYWAGLNDATLWLVGNDAYTVTGLSTVLTSDRASLNPAFAAIRPGFAAAVRGLHAKLPATTPIAWTRGLQPDGTWSKDSPYDGDGGHIVFLGGNVSWFRKAELIDREGRPTTDIRAALPPDAVIANN